VQRPAPCSRPRRSSTRARREVTAVVAVGTGPLQPLLDDPDVSDVLVNGADAVWVDRGAGLERSAVRFRDDDAVRALAVRLAASAGRRLDAAVPFVDAQLSGGLRLHAALAPIAGPGTCISLRARRRGGFPLKAFCADGAVEDVLTACVTARLALVVSGGTGSGKTTLLDALLGRVDPRERVVLVEDASELAPPLPHVVRLAARPPNVEGAGGIDLRQLVREALRMRPDRIVVGEVRGAEIADLMLALNTGHDGGATTVHANGVHEVPARLEALGALAGLTREAVHSQMSAALDVVVHLARTTTRHVVAIAALDRGEDGQVTAAPVLQRESGRWIRGPGAGRLAQRLQDRGTPVPPILDAGP